ncbi:MAG: hypothetical protein ACI89Z_001135 [Porticoccus sp.]|jgi:hypothetical protein
MPLTIAKAMLPNMTDEIFNMWLAPEITNNDWPFEYFSTPVEGTDWEKSIGANLSIQKLAAMKWSLSRTHIGKLKLYSSSDTAIDVMLKNFTGPNGTLAKGLLRKSRDRLLFQINHIKRTGKISAPIVAISNGEGFKVLDRYHRLCASFIVDIPEMPAGIWSAKLPHI